MNNKPRITIAQARLAKQELLTHLQTQPELAGIGIISTAHGYCVKVNLSTPMPADRLDIPDMVYGVPVHTEVVGQAYAF